MSGEDKVRDVPIIWEEIVPIPEPLKAVAPESQIEDKEHQKGPKVDQISRGIVETISTSAEVQEMNDSIVILELLSKKEQWLRSQLKTTLSSIEGERKALQAQLVKMIRKGKASSKILHQTRKEKKNGIKACQICKKGHIGKCWWEGFCYRCGQKGHFAHKCPKYEKPRCYKCGIMGHLAKCCPKEVNKKRKGTQFI